ncbi:HAD-like protein [Polychaeton citri CBS 116435]|uniref:HAD-like protein n=1 Tax=Polychaeton citri CBS 116435 TaxID=1314669 RepID=A0A9P4UTB1_9PEZI|nr:HAD-like protein [Polychaeton citri CBS 116435]
MSSGSQKGRPTVLLFDIGGVCVVSPFQAILDYERSRGIPDGWINWSISQSGHDGAWQRLERGEILLDQAFFRNFKSDLSNERRWRAYFARHLAKQQKGSQGHAAGEAAYQAPSVPDIDSEWLYWEMMRISREMDPHMFPALKRLRRHADESNGKLIIGALSNTSIFPPGHPYNDAATPEGKRNTELKSIFDVFVSSAHVGMRKPDEDIYRFAVKELGTFASSRGSKVIIEPGDIVFLDDIGANLRTAKKVGMRTIKVSLGRADLAVKELERITGLGLTSEKARL